jgi:hypothetical protein
MANIGQEAAKYYSNSGTQGIFERLEAVEANIGEVAEKATKLDTTATLTYYVSPTGSDANDGLTSTTPFQKVQKAFDTLKSIYNVVDGIVKIDLAAGTYQEQVFVSNIKSKNRIQLIGKQDANGVPTVIFEGANNANLLYGITFSDFMNVTVQDIKFQNFANSTSRSGLVAQNYVNLWTINVHAYNCGFAGINVNDFCRLYVTGGIVDACRLGVRVYSDCVCTIGYNNPTSSYNDPNHTIIKNCTESGVILYNMSTGHLDFSEVNGCVTGVTVQNSSRLHVWQNLIKNNTKYGVLIGTSSTFFNDTNTYIGNARDVKRGAYSNELSDNESYTPLMKFEPTVCLNKTTLTGVTTETYFNTLDATMKHTLTANTFVTKGQKMKILVSGTFLGAGTKTVYVRIGNSLITGFTSAAGSIKNFCLDIDYYAVSSTAQKVYGRWNEGNAAYGGLYTDRTALLSGTFDITVTGMLSDPLGSIVVETFEVREIA